MRPLFPGLPETAVPLACPVLVENRDAVAAALQERGIGATPWWAGYHQGLDWTDFPESRYLKDQVLALPVHQGLDEIGLDYIADALAGVSAAPRTPKPAI